MPTYYTPTVEDLVWGLTIEKLNKTRWKKIEIKSFFEWDELMSYVGLFSTDLRIKHLDEDDIIELGGHFVGDHWNKAYRIDDFIIELKESTIIISSHKRFVVLYDGQCRNKAELKRLMNNLNITK